jgi:YfiH family protein
MTLPAIPEAFEWAHSSCGLVLKCRPLDAIASHVFTTRAVPLSTSDDWQLLARTLGAEGVVTPHQVHGRDVGVIKRGFPPPVERPTCDALVSECPEVAVAIRAADCVPVLLADARSGAVAAVHAGWRGVAAGAIGSAIETMVREFRASPAHVHAAIGPAIGSCCYEVGSELVDAFAAAGHARYLIDRWFQSSPAPRGRFARDLESGTRSALRLDLPGASRDQLVLAGVAEDRIHLSGLCTAMHLDVFTSYRAEKERAGRIAGAIRPTPR